MIHRTQTVVLINTTSSSMAYGSMCNRLDFCHVDVMSESFHTVIQVTNLSSTLDIRSHFSHFALSGFWRWIWDKKNFPAPVKWKMSRDHETLVHEIWADACCLCSVAGCWVCQLCHVLGLPINWVFRVPCNYTDTKWHFTWLDQLSSHKQRIVLCRDRS